MKRILSILITLSLIISSLAVTVFADTLSFTDVDPSTKEGIAIYKLVNAGILLGDGNGLFRPNDPITRAELTKIVNMIFSYTEKAEEGFSDVNESHWYKDAVLIAKKSGYIVGFHDGTFRGEELVSREQACTILCRVADLYDINLNLNISDEVSEWAMPYVQRVLANAQMTLEPGEKFRATENITRAEFSTVFANFYIEKNEPVYKVEVKNSKGIINDCQIIMKEEEVNIVLPSSVILTTNSPITVTVLTKDGKAASNIKVTVTDKDGKTATATTSSNGTITAKSTSAGSGSTGGGGGGGGGGSTKPKPETPDYSDINSEVLKNLKKVSADIEDNKAQFNGYRYDFVLEVKKGIDKVIPMADTVIIDKAYIKSACSAEIEKAKSYFDKIIENNQKGDLQRELANLHTATINWLVEYFDINIAEHI